MNRRTLLKLFVSGGGLISAAIVAIPALISLVWPVFKGDAPRAWRRVGPLAGFPLHEVKLATLEVGESQSFDPLPHKAVYVWRPAEEEVVVFARNCTDLSCPVNYDPGSECFFCPCHGGIFAKNGDPLAGPPPRPLYRFAHRLNDGVLEIDLRSLPPMT